MVKRDTPLGKDSRHPFWGETIVFATKHQKEKILAPLFGELEIKLVVAEVDTDQLGTFSGEVERIGTVRENLRKKIDMARSYYPQERLFLASEGSFQPHPLLGLIKSNLESLLLCDTRANSEIYAEYITTEVIHEKFELGPGDPLRAYLEKIKFPEHGVIVHPEDSLNPIFKGLHSEHEVAQAILDSFSVSKNGKVILASDLRASHNPTRRNAILEAGKKLLSSLMSQCPICSYPGFSILRGLPGLPCECCGNPTSITKEVLYQCPSCSYEVTKARPDGMTFIDPSHCEHCNP